MNTKTSAWLPSLADLFFCCVFLRLTVSTDSWLLNDADTGYHIRAGEYILHNFTIPQYDIFSYIAPPLPWFAHEWLSEVIMAVVHQFSGLTGIVIFFAFLLGVSYFLLFKFSRSLNCNFVLTVLIVLLATISSSLHWLARPHVFSLLLAILWYAILENYQYKGKDRLYLLPPLMLLWVNLHGGFVIGFILLVIYWFDNAIGVFFSSSSATSSRKQRLRSLTYSLLFCLLFSLGNPYGYHILLFPLQTVSDKFLMDNITEYLSPNFHGPLPFKYLLLLMIGTLAMSRTKFDLIELALVLSFTYMALYSARNIPLYAIVVTPILIRHTDSILQAADVRFLSFFKDRSANVAFLDAQLKRHIWPVIALGAVCVLAMQGVIKFSFDQIRVPVAALEFIKKEQLRGNAFNNDEFGDYLIYAAWPEYKVFFDGRSDMYGQAMVRDYLKVATIQPEWEKVLEKYQINWLIDGARAPLSTFLLENKNWHLVYTDKVAAIFVKNVAENRHLMDKYPDVKPLDPSQDEKKPD